MEWWQASTDNCPIGRTLELLGEKWTLLIVRDALNGVRRFDDFRRHMGLSEAVLADRLRKLSEAGVLEARAYQEPGRRERHEYRVTAKGRELVPVMVALKQWGETHCADPAGQVIELRHRNCEGQVRVVLQCGHHKGQELSPRDMVTAMGPGARAVDPPRPPRR
jgi:DNA-binding HxlR family transcriptional regulator